MINRIVKDFKMIFNKQMREQKVKSTKAIQSKEYINMTKIINK